MTGRGRIGFIALVLVVKAFAQIPPESLIAKDPVTRQAALRKLAALSPAEKAAYVPKLVMLMRQSQKLQVPLAFAKIGPAALPTLIPLLDDADPVVRGLSAMAVAMISPTDSATVEKLHKMIKDLRVRDRVAPLLLGMGIQDADAVAVVNETCGHLVPRQTGVPSLIAALESQDNAARENAARNLYDTCLVRADVEAAFIKALKDPSEEVRKQARYALKLRGFSEAAGDALLEDEMAEAARKEAGQEQARATRLRTFTRDEVLAPLPGDADHGPLTLDDQAEVVAPDGTAILATVHIREDSNDLLRLWRREPDGYHLIQSSFSGDTVHLTVDKFRYAGKVYLHVMNRYAGTGYQHEDDFFRVEGGKLTKLRMTKAPAPPKGEVWKGSLDTFNDDDLRYSFGIWLKDDANCCPSGGSMRGNYIIAGDEIGYGKPTITDSPWSP